MGRVLALDYGQKRVGVAVTDELQMIANALTTVHSKDIWDFLKTYLAREKVDCIVVGEPRQMNNMPSESAKFIEPFVKQLKKLYPDMEIKRIDERFTSKMASFFISQSGKSKKQRQEKGLIDKVSATILLQNFLDQKR